MTSTRRQFLANAAAAGAGLGLSAMTVPAELPPAEAGFGIKIFATRWGYKGTMDDFCRQVKAEGYDGVEDWIPQDHAKEAALFEALDKYGLSFAALAGSGGNNFSEHLQSYTKNLQKALSKKSDFVNCHAGKDFFTMAENQQLINIAIQQSKATGVPVYQETHRGRMLFAAHVCGHFIAASPELQLTLDISHWCAVAESLLSDQKAVIAKVLQRTGHVHARIGHAEGPQVSDPRAPEWQKERNAHFAWWDEVVALKKAAGEPLTVTTEFGPPNYMWTTAYTQQPLADQWAINVHMMHAWRKRYL